MSEHEVISLPHELTRMQIEQVDGGLLELRYFKAPSSGHLSWKLTADQAEELAGWWMSQGCNTGLSDLPIRNLQVGCVLISMVTLDTFEVRGLDAHNTPKLQGYLLPREVIEFLSTRMRAVQQPGPRPIREVAEACSRES